MSYLILVTAWDNKTFQIKEDLPDVGVYLYCYENNFCFADYLQNTIEDCKEYAFQEFGVPLDSWETAQK